jgi:hypothetical protein
MKLKTNWHSTWTPWVKYQDRQTGMPYKSRRRQLFCGKLLIATLVQTTNPRHKQPFFMYAAHYGCKAIEGSTVFRTVRNFTRQQLAV